MYFDQKYQRFQKWIWNEQEPVNRINNSHIIQNRNVLVAYRVFCSIYLTIIQTLNSIQMENVGMNIMYMTMWGANFVWAYFIFAMLENLTYNKYRRKSFFVNVWKVAHFLFELAWVFELVIVIVFWVILFPQLFNQSGSSMFLNVNIHGIFFLLLIGDFLINNIEFFHRHLYIIILIALIYIMLINMPYTLIWSPIYPGINWCKSGSTGMQCLFNWIIVLIALILFFLQYLIGFKVYKNWKEQRINKRKQDQILGSISDTLTDNSVD